MRLLQFKLRGLGSLPITDWVTLSGTITLLRCTDRQVGRQILKAVQSLNPPYDCHIEQPFSNLPREEILPNGSRRVIAPEKRTIVIGIFDTPSFLVKELGEITPPLYETDRVEVGRRLDYSRWINFVEIASSSRWSEVSNDIQKLIHEYPDESGAENIHELLSEAVPSDRVKGEMAEQLARWLVLLQDRHPGVEVYPELLEKVLRARRFAAARELLNGQLPRLFRVNSGAVPQVTELTAEGIDPQITPVMLIDCFDSDRPDQHKSAVPEDIAVLAKHCQCLCFSDTLHPGWDLPDAQVVEVDALN